MPTQNGHSLNGHSSNGNGRVFSPQSPEKQTRESIPVDWEKLARATAHPLRVSILEILGIDGGRVLSPSDLSRELQIPLSNTNYHVTELAKSGLIELVRERPVRGATEHFYRLPTREEAREIEPARDGAAAAMARQPRQAAAIG